MGNLERFIALGDSSGAETIWTCCVTCLAHLAALCHHISQRTPTSNGTMDYLCDLTLNKLGNVSLEVHIEQYTHFDVLTGVRILTTFLWTEALTKDADQMSWKRALDIIDARIGLSSDIESGSLRRWRKVIEKAYVDLQVGLLAYGPSLFALLVMEADGRTEGSSFPNFLAWAERERYGL